MNKLFISFILAAFLIGCASTGNASNFSDITEKEWKLTEVSINRASGKEILFNRDSLSNEDAGNFYTLAFEGGRISGRAAPNLYNSSYTLGEKNAISIRPMASTMMASLNEPENLREHVFYSYMHNVYKWEFENEKLILFSKTEDGLDVRLMFL